MIRDRHWTLVLLLQTLFKVTNKHLNESNSDNEHYLHTHTHTHTHSLSHTQATGNTSAAPPNSESEQHFPSSSPLPLSGWAVVSRVCVCVFYRETQ